MFDFYLDFNELLSSLKDDEERLKFLSDFITLLKKYGVSIANEQE